MTTPTLKEGDLLIETGIGRMRDGCWCWRARGAGLSDFLPYLRPGLAAHRGLIPKLADPDSPCVNSSGTSIAKTYDGPMRYGQSARAPALAKMSQAFRSLVSVAIRQLILDVAKEVIGARPR